VLLAEVKNVQGGVEHDYNAATTAVNGLSALLDRAKQRALELNLLEIEYNRLRRKKENGEKLYGMVTERSKENDLTRLLRFNNLRVVDRPELPRAPVTPNMPMNIGAGLLLGLVLGLLGVVLKEQLDRSIKTPEDAERVMACAFLGLVPLVHEGDSPAPYSRRRRSRREPDDPHNRPELVVHYHPTSGIAEAARAVRTNILFMSPDRPYRTLLVTSAAPFEGKTTVACCIAVAMAQAGRRVVLLDCDMRRPRIHRVFGGRNDRGITTALLDLSTIEESLLRTEVPNLSVMPTGPLPPNPAELLHSEAFERLLTTMQESFDTVVIDSPPVAPVTDAAILSTRVDGTVLVARSRRTRKDVARRAVRAITDVGGRIVGTVLNAVDFNRRGDGYSQYYYYRQTGYGPDKDPAELPPNKRAEGNGASNTLS
jgi:polysaccharide biosynthesis transport protein